MSSSQTKKQELTLKFKQLQRKFRLNEHLGHTLVPIYPPSLLPQLPQELIKLAIDAIGAANSANLNYILDRLSDEQDKEWVSTWPGEHYKFLNGLAKVLKPNLVVEIGTYKGTSCLALAEHSKEVITYDLVDIKSVPNGIRELDLEFNIEQRIGDLSLDDFFNSQAAELSNADLLFIDGPKNITFEEKVIPKVLKHLKSGTVVVIDDIRFENMQNIWINLISYPRIDIGCFAHSSGTGLLRIQ